MVVALLDLAMADSAQEHPEPPPPPELHPRIQIRPLQIAGLVFLAAFPLLAFFNVFGDSQSRVSASSEIIELDVSYPSRFRYKSTASIEARITNTSQQPLEAVTVRFDENYVNKFSEVSFTPDVKRAYEVEITDLRAGQSQLISVEIQAEKYGRHSGTVSASSGDDLTTVSLATFVFP
jgi:hypothetical protein